MNTEQIVAGEHETYPDERKKDGDGVKDGLGRWETWDLRRIQGSYGCVQCRHSILPPLRWLGPSYLHVEIRSGWESVVRREDCKVDSEP